MNQVLPLDDERRLVRAAQGGDRAALEQLVRAQQPQVYAVCRRLTGNDADALDATQEALIALVRGLGRFDGRSRLSTWAFRIATNASLDELRRRGRRPALRLADDDPGADVADAAQRDPADEVAEGDAVDAALALLPEEFRVAVVLRDLIGLDYAEIAATLQIPPGTVRSRIARGRAQLADRLVGNQSDPTERPTSRP